MKKNKLDQNRIFGIVFSFFFLSLLIINFFFFKKPNYFLILLIILLILITIIKPSLFHPLNKLWLKLGFIIGTITTPILSGLLFFLIVTPIGFIFKILKKDILKLNFERKKTYWVKKELKSNMKDQF